MAVWEFITYARTTGVALASLNDLQNRRISLFLNQPGSVEGTIDLSSPQANRDWLEAGVHELKVRRNGVELETVFQLATVNPALDDEGSGDLELGWLGILSYFSDVTVGPDFSVASAAQDVVAFTIISTIQAKAGASVYAVTDGTHTAGQPSKTFDSAEERDGKESLTNLGDRADGFDFVINPDREFQTFFPERGSDASASIVFEHGKNCRVDNLLEDASPGSIGNEITIKGANNVSATASDVTSRGAFGRREMIISLTDETDVTRLQQYADAILGYRKDPRVIPLVQVDTDHPQFDFDAIDLGDTIRLIVRAGVADYVDIDSPFRIVAIHIELDEEGHESVTLELNAG